MNSIIADVAKLMQASGQAPSDSTADLYAKLMLEEWTEFRDAHMVADDTETFDACLDLIWVTAGYMIARGWPIPAGWAEVVRSNHAKIVDGRVLRRADGKTLKPEGWTPPQLAALLNVRDAGPFAFGGRKTRRDP